jgi:undecaprenyl diphosphate synthase|tara:strand:+ start:1757 stop:2512 length:756 start_codon:yes stop_codon:yes gene_type:complete
MQESQKEKILVQPVPKHIAIIMDGNGRWARGKTLPRIAGHREGVNSVREITRVCGEIGVQYLTLYTFSIENWKRPAAEVSALMTLLLRTINKEVKGLHKNNVKFNIIGDLEKLPVSTKNSLQKGADLTAKNTGLTLSLALNYGSRQEIIEAVQKIVIKVKNGSLNSDEINENIFSDYLYTKGIPDPDLMIRTSGESRLSNFLLWQSAYTEIYMTDTFWPEFREKELMKAVKDYQSRERRFGKVSDQLRGLS